MTKLLGDQYLRFRALSLKQNPLYLATELGNMWLLLQVEQMKLKPSALSLPFGQRQCFRIYAELGLFCGNHRGEGPAVRPFPEQRHAVPALMRARDGNGGEEYRRPHQSIAASSPLSAHGTSQSRLSFPLSLARAKPDLEDRGKNTFLRVRESCRSGSCPARAFR